MLQQEQLVVLLLRVAVAASLASILVRFPPFQRMLMDEDRSVWRRVKLAITCSAPFAAGVAIRILIPAYQAVDMGLEGSLLAGLIGGYFSGLLSGVMISVPAMFAGELMSMPLFAGAGVLGGLLRDVAPEKEDVWRISPFLDVSFRRIWRSSVARRRSAFQAVCVFSVIFAELVRQGVAGFFPAKGVFSLAHIWAHKPATTEVGIYASCVFAIILPIKIWNNTRNEKKLETQQLRLNEARLAALTRQINPHFLFNTLNSVSSLIRTNPEQARNVVYKLSSILRRLLRKTESLTTLREELSFIDNYMAIELVRFGQKLRYLPEIEPATLDHLVPSMMLQPIIENSIRHGLSGKVEGGMISVRSQLIENRLHLLIEDDGVGMEESRLATLFESGIGVSNVNERLKVLFGGEYRMWVDSRPGGGTRTGIELPANAIEPAASLPAAV